mgnify:CR=1 FL=1
MTAGKWRSARPKVSLRCSTRQRLRPRSQRGKRKTKIGATLLRQARLRDARTLWSRTQRKTVTFGWRETLSSECHHLSEMRRPLKMTRTTWGELAGPCILKSLRKSMTSLKLLRLKIILNRKIFWKIITLQIKANFKILKACQITSKGAAVSAISSMLTTGSKLQS